MKKIVFVSYGQTKELFSDILKKAGILLATFLFVHHASAAVVISELMYDPPTGTTNEFVELHNNGAETVDIGGWYFSDGITYTFASPTLLSAGARIVVVTDRISFHALYPEITNLADGAFDGKISNDGETVTLADSSGNAIFSVTYSNLAPWPPEAAGGGHSLVLVDESGDPDEPSNWSASSQVNGSPGLADTFFIHDVVINEILAHTDPPQEDAIELYNLTTNVIDVTGWYLSDDNSLRKKYRLPADSVIPPHGYLTVYQYQLAGGIIPFALSAGGESIYLSEADDDDNLIRYVDNFQYEASQNGISFGRYPDGTGEFLTLSTPTFGVTSPSTLEEFRTGTGARNAGPKVGPVVINEIMYHPPDTNLSGRLPTEYIELLNISDSPVQLFDPDFPTNAWSFTGGISYHFTTNLIIQPGEFLLVTATNDLEAFRTGCGLPPDTVILGPWERALGNGGDTVRLRAPNHPDPLTGSVARYIVDEVIYDDQLPWPLAADGLGGALERTDSTAYGNTADNWHSTPDTATPGTENSLFLPPGSIVISEIMSINRNTLQDEDGDFSDWIELHNTTFQSVSLNGWHLTDQPDNPTLWTFPDVSIPPYGQILIFASSKDRRDPAGELHANFSLSADGEYLALIRADLTVESAFDPAYPALYPDVSYGYDTLGTRVETPVRSGSSGRYLVPASAADLASGWNTTAFDDSTWKPAGNGIGYDTDADYRPYFQTDLYDEMHNKQSSAFVRYSFILSDAESVTSLLLRLRFEDGFIAWLNGVQIASTGAPSSPAWDSSATSTRDDSLAIVFTEFNLDSFTHLLNNGTNVLAFQSLNTSSSSSDLLLASELRISWSPALVTKTAVEAGTPGRYIVPVNATELAADWNTATFNDTSWNPAGNGIGYDLDTDYLPYIQTDIQSEMYNKFTSAFVRYPFVISDSSSIYTGTLRMKFDDGFTAWINGTLVASGNAPSNPVWDSKAPGSRSDSLATVFLDFSMDAFTDILFDGTNVLSVQVMNNTVSSSDLLMQCNLAFSWTPPSTGTVTLVEGYLNTPTPGSVNDAALSGITPAPALSHPGGVFSGPLSVSITCPQADAVIRYTLDGSEPTSASPLYTGPLSITEESELLARAFATGLVPSPITGAVYRHSFLGINEIMASNANSTPEINDFTDFGDWIELYNGGTNTIDLSGYHLSDNLDSPFRWRIPDGASIPAGGHLVFWADGEDSRPGLSLTRDFWPYASFTTIAYHTNFKLSSDGEAVGLFTPGGTLVDGVTFGLQSDDISLGRYPDGSNNWGYFGEPTAGAVNQAPQLTQNLHFSPAVTISPDAPLFIDRPVTVTLAAGTGATAIHYTLDCSRPTSASPLYTVPFAVTSTTVVRARSFADNLHPGPVTTRTFLINQRQPDLPVVSLVVDPLHFYDDVTGIFKNNLKKRDVPVSLQFCTTPTETAFQIDAGLRIFSLNTFLGPQKPFTINLDNKYGAAELNYQLFPEKPIGQFDRFILRNGNDDWNDAYLRDGLCSKIMEGRIVNIVQAYKPTVSYLNGQYYGLINIREKLDEMIVVKNEGVPLEYVDFYENDGTSSDSLLDAGTDVAWQTLNDFLDTHDLSVQADYDYVRSQVDLENLMDYVIANSFVNDTAWSHNRKWWRDRRPNGRWHWGFLDLDRALVSGHEADNRIADMTANMTVFHELMDNQGFRETFAQRYAAHINSTFNPDRVIPIIDREAAILRNEMPYYVGLYGTQGGIPSVSAWESQIEVIRNFVRARRSYVMQHLVALLGADGTAQVAINTTAGGGQVLANSVSLDNGATNTLIAGVPVQLSAIPEIGQTFAYWVVTSNDLLTVVSAGSEWHYMVPTNTVTGWETPAFDDSAWDSGAGQLGYGDGDEATVIGSSSDNITAAYFRKTFIVTNAASINSLNLQMLHDDGAVVYLNGEEILRTNMPEGAIDVNTLALTNITGSTSPAENDYQPYVISPVSFQEGANILAVEIHQSAANFYDLGFDLAATVSRTISDVQTNTSPVLTLIPDPAPGYSIQAVFVPDGTSLLPPVVSGTLDLTAAGSPYLATGDIYVPSNTCLTAEPGVAIQMPENASIHVQGELCLLGTAMNPVQVVLNTNLNAVTQIYSDPELNTSTNEIRWGGISFDHADKPGILSNVVIRGASMTRSDAVNMKAAVSALESDLFMYGLDIDDVDLPIFVQSGSVTVLEKSRLHITTIGDGINIKRAAYARVEECEIYSDGLSVDADAIDYDGIFGGIIRGNHLHDFMGDNNDAIDIGEGTTDLLVESNRIERCFDKAVSIGQGSTALVRRNIIRDVDMGLGIKDSGSYGLIENNTFIDVNHAVAVYEKNPGHGGGIATVLNCIVSQARDVPFTCDALSTLEVSCTLSDEYPVPGTGNIIGDPLFVNPKTDNYELQTGSPAIDSGALDSETDPDGSRADMGAMTFDWRIGHAVISEIHYHPANVDEAEYLELTNPGGAPLVLSGYSIVKGIDFIFPEGTVLNPGDYLVIASSTNTPDSTPDLIWTNGVLNNAGETVQLIDTFSNEVDSVTYAPTAPWPVEPDGGGDSLALIHPCWDNSQPSSWHTSGTPGGTPGSHYSNPASMPSNRIFVTVSGHGTVSPAGTVMVPTYGSPQFTITPGSWCFISNVLVDSSSVGTPGIYGFNNVLRDHTLHAVFGAETDSHDVPRWWLEQLNAAEDFETTANADPDNDGMPTWAEYVAGTQPTNAASIFRLSIRSSGSGIIIDCPTTETTPDDGRERFYTIECCTNLPGNIWFALPGYEDVPATGGSLTISEVPDNTGFIRAKVLLR